MQERNDLGLQLIERNEEVCVFYERRNVSESLLRKAGMELSAREEELHFLRMEVREGGGKGGGRKVRGEGRRELTVNLMVVCRPSTCSNCTNSGIVCTSTRMVHPHTHMYTHTPARQGAE